MNIPDLRYGNEITLEHCSVLLEKLGEALDTMDGQKNGFETHKLNPQLLLEHFEEFFDPAMFTRLFQDEYGKYVLIGTYLMRMQQLMLEEELED